MRGDIALSTDNRPSSLKKVSWETLQNLCQQVRLFAAEDAPSLLGTTLQELYQAKETKFMHAAKPVSESDMPPGFVNFGVRQPGGCANTSMDMETQVHWCCPEKFLLKAAWQVAAGNESIEAFAEKRRELGVPEATYLNLNLIAASPGEPSETSAETKDTVVSDVPLFSVEDDDELDEGFSPGGDATQSPRKGVEKAESQERPSSLLSDSSASSLAWPGSQPDQGASSSFMSDADPNVAAAAAAAYAVLKAKERGALVDHDLLIKILTNPILIKTLLASKQNMGLQLRDLSRTVSEGLGKGSVENEPGRSLGNASVGSSLLSLPVPIGSKASIPTNESMPEAKNIQAWNMSSHFGNSRPFMGSRAEENFYGRSEIQGSGLGTSGMGVSPSQMLPHHQDVLKDLIYQHGMERSRNEGLSRGLSEMEFIGNAKPLSAPERHRHPIMGPFSQLGPGGQHVGASTHGRGEGFSHARFGSEASQSRFQKPCIYFNTPKGCRRGTSCFYLHTSVPEQPFTEQPRTDFFPFPSAKRPKFGVPDRD